MNNEKQEHLVALHRALNQTKRLEGRFGRAIIVAVIGSIFNVINLVNHHTDSGVPLMFSLSACGILVCIHHSYYSKANKLKKRIFKLTIG